MNELRNRWLGRLAKGLAVTLVALIGLLGGIALPGVTPSTVVKASESDSVSRAGRWQNSDSAARSMPARNGGSSFSALPGSDESLAQAYASGANGKIAFSRSLSISEVRVVNADGSNQRELTSSQGFDGAPVWSPDGSRIAFGSGRDGNAEIYMMNSDGSNQTRLTNDPAPDYNPVWSPDGSRIAFIRYLNNNYEIYVINADGGSLTQLTNNPAQDHAPTWSPDGSKIAFRRYQTNIADSQIYVMNADGSNQTLLTNERASPPIWSPDGSRIVFSSARGSFSEIYVVNANGSNPTRLTFNIGNNSDPDWSPDGKKIAFTNEEYDYYSVYVMNADGSGQTRLTHEPPGASAPIWSPDGARIAFSRDVDIYVMNADGSGQTRMTNNSQGFAYQPRWSPDSLKITFQHQLDIEPDIYVMNGDGSGLLKLTNHPAIDREPAWSPDGSRISFVSYRDNGINIYVMNADGSGQTRLTSLPGFNIEPDWSPDGTKIAFAHSHNSDTAIYVMNADGSNLTRLTDPGTLYGNPTWSPDGARIAFARFQNGNQEIYVMNSDGSGQVNLTNSAAFDGAPAWSPDGSRIVFTQLQNPNTSIHVMNADGSNQIRLSNNSPGFDGEPVWSPDGSTIAFASNRNNNLEIYLMNSDGSNQTRITHNLDANSLDPDWTTVPLNQPQTPTKANGRIAFTSNRDGNPEIYSINPDGTGSVRLTFDPGTDDYPAWSPDGSKIAYLSQDQAGQYAIKIMNATGGSQRIVTPVAFDLSTRNFCGERFSLSWSRDGNRIAFQESGNIVAVNLDGTNRQNVTDTALRESEPSWGPTGLIAYAATLSGGDGINGLDIRTTGGDRYADYGYFTCSVSPDWSPDSTKLAYIHSYDFPPPGFITIIPANPHSSAARVFNFFSATNVRWSPDGKFLALTSCEYPNPCKVEIVDEFGLGRQVLSQGTNPSWQPILPAACPNAIDCAEFFVRQHYLDFLNREPDAGGLAFWTTNITKCSEPGRRPPAQTEAECADKQKTTTSAAFFLSPEFQYTGYFVYRLYKGSLIQNGVGRPPTYQEFLRDVRKVANGIIQNNQLSAAAIEANKKTFAEEFTRRAEFRSLYDPLSNFDYVERLFQTTGIDVNANAKQALVDGLNNQTETRASVLQKVVDGAVVMAEGNQQFTTSYGRAFYEKEFNAAFVLMEYFGYLQRDPDPAGYQHWLDKLNLYGNYIEAEMVKSFITSPEYRSRFGQP